MLHDYLALEILLHSDSICLQLLHETRKSDVTMSMTVITKGLKQTVVIVLFSKYLVLK